MRMSIRRTHLLMDPEEFRLLKKEARRRKTSVAELIRSAVWDAYLAPKPDRGSIVDAILAMRLRIGWKRIVDEIQAGHARLP